MERCELMPHAVPGAGTEVAALRAKVQAILLDGPGVMSPERRRAAYNGVEADPRVQPLLDTVAQTPWKVTDELVAAARQAGLSEDAVFELVVATAVGTATRQLAAAHRALSAVFPEASSIRPQETP